MKPTPRLAVSFLVLLPLTACDLLAEAPKVAEDVGDAGEDVADDVADGVDDTIDDVPEDLAARLEEAIFEKLQCEELARPSTLGRIRDLLRDPTFEELTALVTNPQDLATVVSMGGAEIEGAVVVARNLERLVSNGTAQALLDGGWDGVSCGEGVPLACTAGDETTTVSCDAETVSGVAVQLEQCTLGGTVHDGEVTFTRVDGASDVARLTFANLAFDEIKVLDGSLAVALQAGGLHATLGDGLDYTEHGGPDGGLECGARLALDALELDVDGDGTAVAFAGERVTTSDRIAIATTAPLRFPAAPTCACPLPGGGLAVELPRPLGRDGESATAQVTFASSTDPGLCAQASVTLVGWPTSCAGDVTGDCSKGATQAVLSQVFSALCTSP